MSGLKSSIENPWVCDIVTDEVLARETGVPLPSHAQSDAAVGEREVVAAVLVGTAASRFTVAPVPPEAHLRTLVVHGEHDETVPLTSVMDWARPQTLPVTVVPGGGHFFHGQLPLLRSLATRHLQAVA